MRGQLQVLLHFKQGTTAYTLIGERDSASFKTHTQYTLSLILTVLVAIRWVAIAWSQVTPETIVKCFRKAGILSSELDVISRGNENGLNPFLEADECMELEVLIEKIGNGGCTVDKFLTSDSDLSVCREMDENNWDTAFLEDFRNDQDFEEVAGSDTNDDDDTADREEPPS